VTSTGLKTQRLPILPIADVLQTYQKLVTELLYQKISRDQKNRELPVELRGALLDVLTTQGKLIRPTVVLLSCQAAGGTRSKALLAAVSVELMHNAILIYDDIIDHDRVRRGVPAVHAKYGQEFAIVLAGIMVSRALNLISRTHEALPIVCGVLHDLGVGEAMELRSGIDDKEDYLRMIGKKTASLFKASALLGATLADSNQQKRRSLAAFGWNLGMAFQIRDDILGSIGDEKILGKPVGSDFLNGRPNIVSIYHANALGVSPSSLSKIINQNGLRAVTTSPEFQVAIEQAERLCELYKDRSTNALMSMAPSPHRECLLQLADYVQVRAS
jgi:geranylgeranyl diphosphate synthase type I